MSADIFRILSRSTKLSQGARHSHGPLKYPSSATRAVPEDGTREVEDHSVAAAHSAETALRSQNGKEAAKKRKGQSAPGKDLLADIDFFNDGAVQLPHIVGGKDRKHESLSSENDGSHQTASDLRMPQLGEDECRRVLQHHKIKVTVLEDWERAEESEVSRRRLKKRKRDEGDTTQCTKRHKKQLFPQPLTSFSALSPRYRLSKTVLGNIQAQGFKTPTDVQMAAIPLLLDAQAQHPPDLLNVAPTGSGKTLAFLIPTIDAIMRIRRNSMDPADPEPSGEADADDGPLAIVLAPTKELANQIVNEGRKLSLRTGIRVSLMRKGMNIVDHAEDQPSMIEASAEGDSLLSAHVDVDSTTSSKLQQTGSLVKAHLLVSTPLHLLHAITRTDGSILPLPTVRSLILDEADVLLDPLFREQVLSIWNACTNLDLRISMWSATMGSNIEALARDTIASRHSSLTLTTTASPRTPLLRLVIGLKDTSIPIISHRLVYAATEAGKLMALRQLIHPTAPTSRANKDSDPRDDDLPALHPPFLIFTQTIARAVALAAELQYDVAPYAGGQSRITALHADLSDTSRDAIMNEFRKGEIWILITTDLLARGVDFRGINGVVNYDVPTSAASYIHRAGRTGRAGREGGVAVTLYAEEDVPFIKPIANVIAMSEKARNDDTKAGAHLQQWLLDSLPTPTKREKKKMKQKGIESRRPGKEKARISTKSGFERKVEHRRNEAREAAKRRRTSSRNEHSSINGDSDDDVEFEGFVG